MFKNYIKITIRNLFKQKIYSLITIFGLSVGITCCLLIMLYVRQEMSYDNFYPNADNIYRIGHKVIRSQGISYSAATPAPVAPALEEEYPEIAHITRIYFDSEVLFEYESKRFYENNVIYADPDFFEVFPFRLLKGDSAHLLDTPESLVLTATTAQKYFGDENPLGKVLRVNNQDNFLVTGVIEDIPVNSHYHFDFVISFLAKNEQNFGIWLNAWTGITTLYTYAVLPKSLDIQEFTSRAEDLITRHSGKRPGIERKLVFQPLRSIHLHSHFEDEIEANNYVSNIIILSMIAFLILVIACINYMNLATSQSARRAREVGMRKVLGAQRFQLTRQFMGESILLTLLAMFISLASLELLLPAFSSLVGEPVDFSYGNSYPFLAAFLLVILLVGVVSSIYPALFLSRHQPIRALKGLKESVGALRGHLLFKKLLVVVQFVVSILLIICTLIINKQLHYMKNAQLGFDKEHMVVFPVQSESSRRQYESIKNELMINPGILRTTACLRPPISDLIIVTRAWPEGSTDEETFLIYHNFVDLDYLDLFEVELVAGRKFSKEYSTDLKEGFIINEATVRKWGMASAEEAIGKRLRTGLDLRGTIIGVMKDHHISSFHQEIEPMVLSFDPQYFWTMAIKIKSTDISGTLAAIEEVYAKFIPEFPFVFSFLDEDIDRLYRGEEQTSRIIRTFSIIAVFIACLGLFGLAAFAAERRTKEIGIRKVLGATTSKIIFLLSTEFSKWVLVSNIVAWPIAYYAMNRWLQGFTYRTGIGLWIFFLAALITFIVALLTVSYQAIKAAVTNPVDALRYE